MLTTEARKTFESALKDISRVRFFDYKSTTFGFDKQITVKPKAVEICDKKDCNAGSGCIHRTVKRGITFCVY